MVTVIRHVKVPLAAHRLQPFLSKLMTSTGHVALFAMNLMIDGLASFDAASIPIEIRGPTRNSNGLPR